MYYSFVMLKPDALKRQLVVEIINRLRVKDISIEIIDYKLVDEELIFKHYEQVIARIGETFKEKARASFVGKYVIPMIISSSDENVIALVREVIGATNPAKASKGTIRGDLGADKMEIAEIENRCIENLIHASDSYEAFLTEAELWFGKEYKSFLKEGASHGK